MKITKLGKIPQRDIHFKCPVCGCEWEEEMSAHGSEFVPTYLKDQKTYGLVAMRNCPVCYLKSGVLIKKCF